MGTKAAIEVGVGESGERERWRSLRALVRSRDRVVFPSARSLVGDEILLVVVVVVVVVMMIMMMSVMMLCPFG